MNSAANDAGQYPGGSVTIKQIHSLAEEYRRAAQHLLQQRRRGEPLSLAPCRLSAIHAIELYLSVFLLHSGHESHRVRGMQHDLATRARLAIEKGLQLRKRTAEHLVAMASNREYLTTRYAPEMTSTMSQINRLIATLDEVARKVTVTIGDQGS